MLTSTELLGKVNDFLANLSYDRKPESIYAPIKYVLSIGGKRIRPVLMLLAYNLYKDNPESILMQACALETYHNYTLLHDDLMDNADVRRGKPTVHRKWDANTAILSGDSMLVLAYQRMAQCDPAKLKPVLDLFTETALEIGEGQQYDMDFERRTDVTEAEYIEMIRLKTSRALQVRRADRAGLPAAGRPARRIRRPCRVRQGHRRRHRVEQENLHAHQCLPACRRGTACRTDALDHRNRL